MDLKLNFIPLKILGYLMLDIPDDVFLNLKQQVEELKNKNFEGSVKYNNALYSAIENEYVLKDSTYLEKFLKHIVPHYYNFMYAKPKNLIKLSDVWKNYQKKYEMNPLHNHGGELSFVIWMSIPYDLEQEKNHPSIVGSKNFKNGTTAFTFLHTTDSNEDFSGINDHKIQLDKSYEGKMILFSSKLPHMVYPFFTSDEYRISIAGNLIEDNG